MVINVEVMRVTGDIQSVSMQQGIHWLPRRGDFLELYVVGDLIIACVLQVLWKADGSVHMKLEERY